MNFNNNGVIKDSKAEPVKELTESQKARARKVARNTSTEQTPAGSYKTQLKKIARNHRVTGSVQEAKQRKIDRQNRG